VDESNWLELGIKIQREGFLFVSGKAEEETCQNKNSKKNKDTDVLCIYKSSLHILN
jgi:hypothetical protein